MERVFVFDREDIVKELEKKKMEEEEMVKPDAVFRVTYSIDCIGDDTELVCLVVAHNAIDATERAVDWIRRNYEVENLDQTVSRLCDISRLRVERAPIQVVRQLLNN